MEKLRREGKSAFTGTGAELESDLGSHTSQVFRAQGGNHRKMKSVEAIGLLIFWKIWKLLVQEPGDL